MKKIALVVLALVMSMAFAVSAFASDYEDALQVDLVPGEYVLHVSYDEVRPGVVCGQDQNGDVKISTPVVAAGTKEVVFWGWIAADEMIKGFSYSINGGEKVSNPSFLYATEDAVKAAAAGFNGVDASRFYVNIPIEADGVYVVKVYAELEGDISEVFWDCELTVGDGSSAGDTTPDDGNTTPDDSSNPGNAGTADSTAIVFMIAAAAVVATVLLKKRAF